MMDFNLMVRNTLWEMDTSVPILTSAIDTTTTTGTSGLSAANTGNQSEEEEIKVTAKGVYEFLTNQTPSPRPFNQLTTAWTNTFNTKIYLFCTEEELNTICYNVISSSLRSTKDPTKFPTIVNIYPLLELIAQLYEYCFKSGVNKPNDAPKYVAKFIASLAKLKQSNPNARPLDYFAAGNPWAQTIKQAHLGTAKQELGKLRMATMDDKSSIYQLVFKLLEARKKVVSLKIPAPYRMLSGAGIVDKIMLEPWTVVNGKFAITDERLRAVYDNLTVQDIVNASLAAYKLYTQQAETLLETVNDADTKNRYLHFIGKSGTEPVKWLKGGAPYDYENSHGPGIEASMQVASFDQVYELLTRNLLNESNYEFLDERKYNEARARQKAEKKAAKARQKAEKKAAKLNPPETTTPETTTPETTTPETTTPEVQNSETSSPTEQKAFEIKPGSNTFLYNYGNLKAAATTYKIEEAANLLKSLQALADHITKREGMDLLGAANNLASAAMMGVKNAGS